MLQIHCFVVRQSLTEVPDIFNQDQQLQLELRALRNAGVCPGQCYSLLIRQNIVAALLVVQEHTLNTITIAIADLKQQLCNASTDRALILDKSFLLRQHMDWIQVYSTLKDILPLEIIKLAV